MFEKLYSDVIVPKMSDVFAYKTVMQVPRLVKISVNSTMKELATDSKLVNYISNDLALITGQKPVVTFVKKSISGFKIREGAMIGCKVTLRKKRMFHFLERLIYIALPRSRDFRGFSDKQFDGFGNFSFGIKEHVIFPEVDYNKIYRVLGMDVSIITSTNSNEEAKFLLSEFGFPFYD